MLFLIVLCVNFIGDGLRDALDPTGAVPVTAMHLDDRCSRSATSQVEFTTDDGTVHAVDGVSFVGAPRRDARRRRRVGLGQERHARCRSWG